MSAQERFHFRQTVKNIETENKEKNALKTGRFNFTTSKKAQ
jgi:hypothetical protein